MLSRGRPNGTEPCDEITRSCQLTPPAKPAARAKRGPEKQRANPSRSHRVGSSGWTRTSNPLVNSRGPDRSSWRRIAGPTNGSPPLPIPCGRRVPSIASPAMPTISSSTANRIAHASTAAHQGREGALAMTRPSGRRSRGGARRQPPVTTGAALDRCQAPVGFPSTSQEAKVLDRNRVRTSP
jgi:hypothetical protein